MSWYDFLPDTMEASVGVLEQNPIAGPILSTVGSVVAGVDVALHGQDSRFLTYDVNKSYLPNFYNNFVQSLQNNYNKDRSMINILGGSLWDGTYDYVGDLHGTPARLGSSLFITQNAVWNELFDKERTERDFGDTLELAWNREAIANISPGQAWATLVGDIYEDTLNFAINSQTKKEAFDLWTERNALFMNPDFDIFDEEQRKAAFEGNQNIGKWSSGLWDALPGQVLDPLNYLPIIGWGGKIGKSAMLLKKTPNARRYKDDLIKAADGEVTESSRHFEWVATASKGDIAQHVSYRESADQILFAELLGKVDNAADAAKVHLAVEFGDEKAIVDLMSNPKYGGSQLLLDNLIEGGYVDRSFKRGKPIEGVIDNPLYDEATSQYLDELLAENTFARRLIDNVFDVDETGTVFDKSSVKMRFRFSGNKYTNIKDQKIAEFKAKALGDHENAFMWFNSGIQGAPIVNVLVRQGIKYGRISGKGTIDIEDTAGDSYSVLLGNLNDLDARLNNKLLKEGLIEQYASRYAAATTPYERELILDEIDSLGRRLIAEKNNIDEITAADLVDFFAKENKKYLKALSKSKKAILPNGELLYDPLFPTQTQGVRLLTDWKLFDTAIVENKYALRGLVGKGKRTILTGVHTFNNIFIAGILGRPARVPREIMQGAPAAYLSGTMGEMYFTPETLKSPGRFVRNMTGRGKRLLDRTATRVGRRDNVDNLYRNAARHQEAIDIVDKAINESTDTLLRYARSFPENLSKTDKQILEEIKQDLVTEIYYHGSKDGLPESIDVGKVFAMSSDKIDAEKYADEAGKRMNLKDLKDPKINIKKQLNAGKTIQIRKTPADRWRTVRLEDVDNLKPRVLEKYEFRVLNPEQNPSTYRMSVVGKNLEVKGFNSLPKSFVAKMGWKSAKEFNEYMSKKSFVNDKKFIQALEEEDLGSFTWKGEVFANPNRVAYNKRSVKELQEEQEQRIKSTLVGEELTPEEITDIPKLKRKEQVEKDYESLTEISDTRTMIADINSDNLAAIRKTLRELKERKKYHQEQKNLFERRAKLREEQIKKTGGIETRGQKEMIVDGNIVPGAFQGSDAVPFTRLASAEPTFDNTMQGPIELYRRVNELTYKSSHIYPNNPQYFDSWANMINTDLRQGADGPVNPIVQRILSGQTDEEIVKYLRNDVQGIRFAESVGIGPKYARLADEKGAMKTFGDPDAGTKELLDFEDYIEIMRYNINHHLPTPIRQAFLDGEVLDASRLRSIYSGIENELPDIIGRVSIKEERRNLMQIWYDSVRGFVKVVGEMPQTAVFNNPMFDAMYKEFVTRDVQLAIQKNIQKGLSEQLSLGQINSIAKNARKSALMEQRRWIYNVPKRTNASEALRLFFPFVSAWAYTYRLAARGLAERPAETIWMLGNIGKAMGKLPYVDENGDPTNSYFDSVALVLPLNEQVANVLRKVPVLGNAIDLGNQIKISTKSLDVFFQGEFFDPGAGIVVAIPISEVVKNNPALAENRLIETVLPFGPSQKFASFDLTLPTYARSTFNMLTQSPEWQTSMGMIALQESAKITLGEREEPLTQEELVNKTNAMFMLRTVIGFASPVSFSIPPNQAFYRQEYIKYLETYPDRDEANWRFLADHPEYFTGMQATTDNPANVFSSVDAVDNLKNHSQLVADMWSVGEGGQEMVGFMANGNGESEYSQPARDWLKNNGPVSGQSYVPVLSPEELIKRSNVSIGWTEWRKQRHILQETARQRGTTIERDPELAWYNSRIVSKLAEANPDWFSEYSSPNRNKYNERADALEILLDDEKWIEQNKDRAVVQYISQFLQYRRDIAALVDERAKAGGRRSLEGNKDLLYYYNDLINNLMNESVEFSEFYSRYFERDMVI